MAAVPGPGPAAGSGGVSQRSARTKCFQPEQRRSCPRDAALRVPLSGRRRVCLGIHRLRRAVTACCCWGSRLVLRCSAEHSLPACWIPLDPLSACFEIFWLMAGLLCFLTGRNPDLSPFSAHKLLCQFCSLYCLMLQMNFPLVISLVTSLSA